jgi:hypothetical protein
VSKNTRITERLGVQLRAEFFSLFNHPNFAQPDHNLTPGYDPFGALPNARPTLARRDKSRRRRMSLKPIQAWEAVARG